MRQRIRQKTLVTLQYTKEVYGDEVKARPCVERIRTERVISIRKNKNDDPWLLGFSPSGTPNNHAFDGGALRAASAKFWEGCVCLLKGKQTRMKKRKQDRNDAWCAENIWPNKEPGR